MSEYLYAGQVNQAVEQRIEADRFRAECEKVNAEDDAAFIAPEFERALRGIALERKAWLFPGSDFDGERAAAIYSQIQTAKLKDPEPHA